MAGLVEQESSSDEAQSLEAVERRRPNRTAFTSTALITLSRDPLMAGMEVGASPEHPDPISPYQSIPDREGQDVYKLAVARGISIGLLLSILLWMIVWSVMHKVFG